MPIEEITLLLEGDGWRTRLPVNSGLTRTDVETAFPRLRNAASSGFVVTGYAPAEPARTLRLELRFDDGGTTELDISEVAEARTRQPAEAPRARVAGACGLAPSAAWRHPGHPEPGAGTELLGTVAR